MGGSEREVLFMEKSTWVVVANSAYAKIYKMEKNRSLVELQVLEHPESRLHDSDLTSSRPGKASERKGAVTRHSMEPTSSPQHLEFEVFARQLGHHLDAERMKGSFGQLYLMASPSFLGLLRKEMDNHTVALVAGEVNKDATGMSQEEIRAHLFRN